MKAKLKTINEAYDKLFQVFYSANQNFAEHLRKQCLDEEKQHRGTPGGAFDFARSHTSDTVSAGQAAKLFAVKRVAEYLNGEKFPIGQDYLHTHRSCFLAAGIADEYGKQVRLAWAGFSIQELATLDYCQFVKIKKEMAAV